MRRRKEKEENKNQKYSYKYALTGITFCGCYGETYRNESFVDDDKEDQFAGCISLDTVKIAEEWTEICK